MQQILNFENDKKIIKVRVTKDWFTIENCELNPNSLFVFGDNILRYGEAGQAQIRREFNSVGLATKIAPGMRENDFFSDLYYDKCCSIILQEIEKIKKVYFNPSREVSELVFPFAGLGTGLSQLPTRAPKVFKFLCDSLEKEFGIKTNPDGTLYV